MFQQKVGALIMAAGKGTRMKSSLAKVMHTIIDEPIIFYLLKSVSDLGLQSAVIVGHEGESVEKYLNSSWKDCEVVWQREQLGTGHAVKSAVEWWRSFENVLVLNGDLPMLTAKTLEGFVSEHVKSKSDCSLLSFIAKDAAAYGRVIRDGENVSIVEYKDATEEQRKIKEVNAGVYVFRVSRLLTVIDKLSNHNAQGEYYLPDVVSLMGAEKMKAGAFLADEDEMAGINDQLELSVLTSKMKERINSGWMRKGVRMTDPSSVVIGPNVTISEDVEIAPSVHILGSSSVGAGSRIGPWCCITNSNIGKNVRFVSNIIVENSNFKDGALAGPFTYVREGSEVCEAAFAGKFVEIKNSVVGKWSKVPHLSYIGDSVIGEKTNIGAGTITCNYDGKKKWRTEIGDRVFIGSDTMLVAPVKVGSDATTGAGSTITKDVPDGALGVSRAKQINIDGWSYKKRGDS